MQIAIDGPAGAGKSTVAREVAAKLNYLYIDTGAMYRALTYQVLAEKIEPCDQMAVSNVLAGLELKLIPKTSQGETCDVFINGINVTKQIREPIISQHVSTVASHYQVREAMVKVQQQLAKNNDVVMDGRDIATTVLPEADLKIYLDASVEERATRRLLELHKQGHDLALSDLIKDIEQRDIQDSTRSYSPLRQAEDAIEIDTTKLSFSEVVEIILKLVARRDKSV